MSDLDIGWAVNDGDALDALDKIEKKGGKSATFLEREFDQSANQLKKTFFGLGNIGQAAMLGIGGATAYGVKAVKEYAKISDAGAASIAGFESAMSRMATNIGRDLMPVVDVFTDIVNAVESARATTVSWLAGEAGRAYDAAAQAEEMQTRMIRGRASRDSMLRQFGLQRARMDDDPVEAARIEAANLRRDTMAKLNADKNMSGNDKDMVITAMEDVISRMGRDAALEMAKRVTSAEKLVQQMDKTTAAEREQFDMAAEQLRIDNLRLEGQNKLADKLETQLEFAKRRRDIERSTLPRDEKNARIAELGSMEEFQLAHTREKLGTGSSRQITSGLLGGAMLEALVFGGAKTKAQETLERIGYDQVKLLGRIAEAVESGENYAVLA